MDFDLSTVYGKTGKGAMAITSKSKTLSSDLLRTLALVDGKSSVEEILASNNKLSEHTLREALTQLTSNGYIKALRSGANTIFVLGSKGPSTILVAETDVEEFFAAQQKVRDQAHAQAKKNTQKTDDVKAREMAAARAKAESEQQALQEVEVNAAAERRAKADAQARIEAENRAREKAAAEARMEAKREAHEEEQAREIAEAIARKESLRKAREEAEALAKSEAEKRARLEVEEKARAKAEEKTRQEAERKAREEAEVLARAEAEMRKRLEAEEKARAKTEEKARQEAERKTREAAEALARAEAEKRKRLEAEEKARAKAEANARKEAEWKAHEAAEALARAEAEKRKHLEAEEKARAKAEANARKEAERKAHEAAEALARAEAEERKRLEAEEKARAKAEEKARIEAERKAREAAETLARAEAEERKRLEAEDKGRAKAEEKARQEAERKAREEAEALVLAEAEKHRRLKAEEEARVEAEASFKAEEAARLRMEAERKAHEEEASLAKAEADERVRRIAGERAKAEAEARAKAGAEEKARKEAETEEQERAEIGARARALAESRATENAATLHTRVNTGKARKPLKAGRTALISLLLLVLVPLALLHVVSLNVLAPSIARLATDRIHEPVTISAVHASLWPSPHFRLDGVTIGNSQDVKIASVRVTPLLTHLFDETKVLKSVEIESLVINQDALLRMPGWIASDGGMEKVQVSQINLRNTKLELRGTQLPLINADVILTSDSKLKQARISSMDNAVDILVTPTGETFAVKIAAKNWQPPLVPRLKFDELNASATATQEGMTISGIEGALYGGTIRGTATIKWHERWYAKGNFTVAGVALADATPAFSSNISLNGKLDAKATYALEANSLDRLFDTPHIKASFNCTYGAIGNIDLSAATIGRKPEEIKGGQTKFTKLTGNMALADNRYQFRQINLESDKLKANGETDIASSQDLTGRVNVEINLKSATFRSHLSLSGDLRQPLMRRAGKP
jgi:hypothetical protein